MEENRNLSGKEGNELRDIEKLKFELYQIQAERDYLLRREQENLIQSRNSNYQSAEGAMQAYSPIEQDTQDVLKKYGINPETITTSNVEQSKKNIVVNNNNTQNKTIIVRDDSEGSSEKKQSKLKAWISGMFSSQNTETERKEREYLRRERSLSRSAKNLTKSLDETSRSLMERLDPRRIGATFSNQLKTIFTVLGFSALASNWPKILEFLYKAEKTLTTIYTNIVEGTYLDKFKEKLVGADSKDKPITTVIGEVFTSGVEKLWEKMKTWFSDRATAVASVTPPPINIWDPKESAIGVMSYLRDVLSAFFGGEKGINKSISRDLRSQGIEELSVDEDSDSGENYKVKKDGKKVRVKKSATELFNEDSRRSINKYDITDTGKLSNNTGASIAMTRSIADSLKGETAKPAAVMTGLGSIEKVTKRTGKSLIEEDSLRELLKYVGIRGGIGDIPGVTEGEYKIIHSRRSGLDKVEENSSGYLNAVKDSINIGWLNGVSLDKKALGEGVWDTAKEIKDIAGWTESLVPVSSPGVAIDMGDGTYSKKFLELSPESIEYIKSALETKLKLEKGSFNFGTLDEKSFLAIENDLRQHANFNKEDKLNELEDVKFWQIGKLLERRRVKRAEESTINAEDAYQELKAYRETSTYDQDMSDLDNEKTPWNDFSKEVSDKYQEGKNYVAQKVQEMFGLNRTQDSVTPTDIKILDSSNFSPSGVLASSESGDSNSDTLKSIDKHSKETRNSILYLAEAIIATSTGQSPTVIPYLPNSGDDSKPSPTLTAPNSSGNNLNG